MHEVSAAAIDRLQMGNAFLRYLKAIEINIRRSDTPKVQWVKIIGLNLVKTGEKGGGLTHRIRNGGRIATNLKPRGRSHLNKRRT